MLSILGKAQDAKIAETMLRLLGAKRHMGRMDDVVLIQRIRRDCAVCRTALGCQWHNSPYGSEAASRRVPSSRRHNVTSLGKEISQRRIAGSKRDVLMMSFPCAQFCFSNWRKRGFSHAKLSTIRIAPSSRVNYTVVLAPDPIRREPRATFDLADSIQFQEDFRSSRFIDTTWPHQCNAV